MSSGPKQTKGQMVDDELENEDPREEEIETLERLLRLRTERWVPIFRGILHRFPALARRSR